MCHEKTVIYVDKRDTSTKPYEIQQIKYRFDKYSRKPIREQVWTHYKYYKTLQGAMDAIRDFRHSWYDKVYYDYPAMGELENEAKYPHIRPTLTVFRYRIIERKEILSTNQTKIP